MTEPILWSRDFDTGIAEIDFQHRNLVRMFNKADAGLSDESSIGVWEHVLHEFLGYAIYHFWTEEDLAQQYGYGHEKTAEASEHFELHRAFAEQVNLIRARLRSGEKLRKAELIDYLRDWLTHHIVDNDTWLVAFILDKQRQASRALSGVDSSTNTADTVSGMSTASE